MYWASGCLGFKWRAKVRDRERAVRAVQRQSEDTILQSTQLSIVLVSRIRGIDLGSGVGCAADCLQGESEEVILPSLDGMVHCRICGIGLNCESRVFLFEEFISHVTHEQALASLAACLHDLIDRRRREVSGGRQ